MTDTPLDAPSEGGVTEISVPLWRPSQARIDRAELTAFAAFVSGRFPDADVSTYEALVDNGHKRLLGNCLGLL